MKTQIVQLLESHGYEIWKGYVVDVYAYCEDGCISVDPDYDRIIGERFVPLTTFTNINDTYIWMGY